MIVPNTIYGYKQHQLIQQEDKMIGNIIAILAGIIFFGGIMFFWYMNSYLDVKSDG